MDEPNLKLLEYRLDQLESANESLQNAIDGIKEAEKSKLLWGISALGSVVLALGGVIWAYRGVIFK